MSNLYFLGNSTNTQMLGSVISSQGKTVVIDGGTKSDAYQLADVLLKLSDGHVDAWFFTHPHHDHIGAFSKIFDISDKIKVDRIYHSFPSIDELIKFGARHKGEIKLWGKIFALLEGNMAEKVHILKKGDTFELGSVKISVLRVYDDRILPNFVNNSSTVLRVDGESASVLFLGDLGEEGGDDLIGKCTKEDLITDYTQMAHHGQCGVKRDFYEYIMPKCCLWPSPDWLWNNDAGDGFNTGPWKTVMTREWMDTLSVTEHIIEKDGTQIIEI